MEGLGRRRKRNVEMEKDGSQSTICHENLGRGETDAWGILSFKESAKRPLNETLRHYLYTNALYREIIYIMDS